MQEEENSVLRQSPFVLFFLSRVISFTSFQMLSVAIGWQMYAITHDAFSLGFVGLAQFLPMILLTLVVGHVADQFNRKNIVFICRIIEGAVAAFLLISNLMGWLGQVEILIAAAILGACMAFERPTTAALLPDLVPQSVIERAVTWSASAGQTAMIIGPTLGGVLFAVGSVTVYATATVALVIASLFTAFIRSKRVTKKAEPATIRTLFLGIDFVLRHPVILGAISLDLFAVLLGGATALMPIFAQDILHTGALGLGLMRTAPAVGALIMSILMNYFPIKKAYGKVLFGSLGVFGLSTIVFALSTHVVVTLIALMIIGGSDVISVVIRNSLVQLQTPEDMRGRVNAVNSLFIGTSNQLGEFESGMLAGFVGAVPAAFIGGLGTLVVAGLWMTFFPSLRQLRSLSKKEPA